jgi:tuftelin-interacting protein 11
MSFFEGWEPLKNPSLGIEIMSSLKDLLEGDDQPHDLSDPYAQLVNEVILPTLRTDSWDAMDPEQPMLCFLELWERLLPPFMLQSVLDHVVMPKLSGAVDSWNPSDGHKVFPIHVWVHPWLPALGLRRIETLNIVPKLRMAVQKLAGMMNPDDHNLYWFNSAMVWSSVIPLHHMVCMLEVDSSENGFRPSMSYCLHQTLISSAS